MKEYSIKQLSNLSGVSTRTLRYYEEIGLLGPLYRSDAGYRFYGPEQADRLLQILYYKERGLPLDTIKNILSNPDFDPLTALDEHLQVLREQKKSIESMIETVEKTILSQKGKYKMSNNEKFKAFREDLVRKNEEEYGEEIREKYGEENVDASNKKMLNLSEEEYEKMNAVNEMLARELKEALSKNAGPGSEEGKKIAALHREWLGFSWPTYSKEAHCGLVDMYLADERFMKYYEDIEKGATQLLHDSVHYWYK